MHAASKGRNKFRNATRNAHPLKQPASVAGVRLAPAPGAPAPAVQSPLAPQPGRPSQAEAEAAVRTLIRWAGENADREGLVDTPTRVARSYRELFAGYEADPREYLERTFEEVGGYDELVVLSDIRFVSFCEHHMLPVVGRAYVGYLPDRRVVGVSKLARVVNGYARRLLGSRRSDQRCRLARLAPTARAACSALSPSRRARSNRPRASRLAAPMSEVCAPRRDAQLAPR